MTVKELIAHLQTFPHDCEVICSRYSDYQDFGPDEVTLVTAVRKGRDYIMDSPLRWHGTMSSEDTAAMKQYVHFAGN